MLGLWLAGAGWLWRADVQGREFRVPALMRSVLFEPGPADMSRGPCPRLAGLRRRLFTNALSSLLLFASSVIMASEVIKAEVEATIVPSPVKYALIAPAGFRAMKDLPLILNLHGGGGSRDGLIRQQPLFDRLWSADEIPPAIVVTPSVTPRGFYMNFKDGSERWEDWITGPFIAHLRKTYPVSTDDKRIFLMGVSMGGMGSLRMAFRYPTRFGAVAALEPGIEPILAFGEMRPKHRFWRGDKLMQQAFGNPVDEAFWGNNNPATIAARDADAIRNSGLQIYVEAGDEDQFWLYEGAEFLHQVLWQEKIKHEYHLVRGADHVGPSLGPRSEEAIKFLFRSYNPWPATPRVDAVKRMLDPLKARVKEKDHYNSR